MRLKLRRIGNSLGVIVPRSVLADWRLAEGDALVLQGRSIRPPHAGQNPHAALDEHKRRLAAAVVARAGPREIRAHGLANLHRWRASGFWVADFDEWRRILECGDDGELFSVMLGRDERSNRLRQSPPYVGILPREEVERLNEEAAG